MKKPAALVLVYALFFLFFIQMTGTLIQSIYVLDLMNTSLDEKALGVLFFFTPVLLLFFRKKWPAWVHWALFGGFILARLITPSLSTSARLFSAGMAVGLGLLVMPSLFSSRMKGTTKNPLGFTASTGMALAVALSIFLRTINFSVDYSLTSIGAWAGWVLCLLLALASIGLEWTEAGAVEKKSPSITGPVFGIFMVMTLVYFVFSAPGVIARWTEGNYPLIVTLVSLLSGGWLLVSFRFPDLIERISTGWIRAWNILFGLSLVGTILAQRVGFPSTPGSAVVVVGAPTWLQQVPLFIMLLLFPVIFVDLRLFFRRIQQVQPTRQAFIPGLVLGSLALVVLVFIIIFTNVWGYIEPVSTPFRNMFWLPFLLITGALSLLTWRECSLQGEAGFPAGYEFPRQWVWSMASIFVFTVFSAFLPFQTQSADPFKTSLMVMTYNIQAGNDGSAERSYERQLALIRQVNPDILALQESDTARISMNNDDYVRYFAGKLGYYSYYGPKVVAGTFGTAILSKYPLTDTRSVFSFSDTDEIGTAEAKIEVGGRTLTIFNVHPDGSKTAKMAFATNLVAQVQGLENVIALGDFNMRPDHEGYQLVAAQLTESWMSLHPVLEGKGYIDHIFISPGMMAREGVYVMSPESATDHPVHWMVVYWED